MAVSLLEGDRMVAVPGIKDGLLGVHWNGSGLVEGGLSVVRLPGRELVELLKVNGTPEGPVLLGAEPKITSGQRSKSVQTTERTAQMITRPVIMTDRVNTLRSIDRAMPVRRERGDRSIDRTYIYVRTYVRAYIYIYIFFFFTKLLKNAIITIQCMAKGGNAICETEKQKNKRETRKFHSSLGTRPTLDTKSSGASGSLPAWPMEDLTPRTHMMAARRREKERRHRIQPIVMLYGSSLLAAMREASLL